MKGQKGEAKGKGKGGKGGKGGAYQFGGQCWTCGQQGHRSWECKQQNPADQDTQIIGAVHDASSTVVGGVWSIAHVRRKHVDNKMNKSDLIEMNRPMSVSTHALIQKAKEKKMAKDRMKNRFEALAEEPEENQEEDEEDAPKAELKYMKNEGIKKRTVPKKGRAGKRSDGCCARLPQSESPEWDGSVCHVCR